MSFVFDADLFGGAGVGQQQGEFSDDQRAELTKLRSYYPELSGWGDLAFNSAWGAFSQDILAVSWADWINERDTGLLAYLYVRMKNPAFDFGGTGLFDMKIWSLGEEEPWITNAPLPEWAAPRPK